MPTGTDPILPYVTTTATLPEEVVVGDKSKDWKISLLEERLESRIIMTNSLEAKVRNLQANLDAAHRELAKRDETVAELEAKAAGTEELLEVAEEGRDKAQAELASLRTQLARAEGIETVATKVLKHANREDDYTNTIDAAWLDELEAVLTPSPDPAPPEPKCPHCGASIGPKSLTCGECGRWLGKPDETRLAILERVAKHAREYSVATGGDECDQAYHLLKIALDELEANPCPSR